MLFVKKKIVNDGTYEHVIELVKDGDDWRVDVTYPVGKPNKPEAHITTSLPARSHFAALKLYRRLRNGEAIQEIVFGHKANYLSLYE